MAYTKYSLTPANNTAAPPDGAPEGMLPSAVNDTMRDMMAQIRDCGDGIRDGTYTMTAPKITGGTITGSTINNSAIGGTTAAAGKFTTLEATGVTTVQAGTVSAPAITTTGDTNTGIYFPAADTIAFTEGGVESMRITSGGQVLINTTTTGSTLTVDTKEVSYTGGIDISNSLQWGYGSSINFRTIPTDGGSLTTVSRIQQSYEASDNYMLIFSTYNSGLSERMRITAGGYFKASNNASYVSSTGAYHEFTNTASSEGLIVRNTNASQAASALDVWCARNTTDNSYYALAYYNTGATAYRFRVADSGNVTNTNGSYGTISDIKNKENIVDATPKLDKIKQLQVRNYNFIGDDLKQIGFVAQEFEQVFPSMVEEHKDKDAEGKYLGTTTKSIKTSVLMPILVKAIQEQQAMIENLTTRLNALEGR
jgi:hypothetical protein